MRTPKSLKPLLFAALFATAATLPTASAAEVYFENTTGVSPLVDVYVDGQLVFDDVLATSATMFPRDIASGTHDVVITPSNLAPGQRDLFHSAVNVTENGTYTLAFAESITDQGERVLTLGLTPGVGTEE